jgi:hypothetical protein
MQGFDFMTHRGLQRAACLVAAWLLTACASSTQGQRVFPIKQLGNVQMSAAGMMDPTIGQDPAEQAVINPFDAVALNNQAIREVDKGNHRHALSLLQRAVRLAPHRTDIHQNLIQLQQWLAQAENRQALGMPPVQLQLPATAAMPEAQLPDLWPQTARPQGASRAAPAR